MPPPLGQGVVTAVRDQQDPSLHIIPVAKGGAQAWVVETGDISENAVSAQPGPAMEAK